MNHPGKKGFIALSALFITSVLPLKSSHLSQGLIAHFKLDGNALDASGNGLHGTVVGLTPTTDRFGNSNSAYAFDRNGYISIGSSTLLNGYTSAAVTGWVRNRLYSNEGGFIVGAGDSRAGVDPFTVKGFGSQLAEAIFCETTKGPYHPDRNVGFEGGPSVQPLPLNTWVHFVSQFSSTGGITTYQLFLNGELKVNLVYNRPHTIVFDQPMPVQMGALTSYTDSQFRGDIDDIRFYNRTLSSDEAITLANGSTPKVANVSASPNPAPSNAASITISATASDLYDHIVGANYTITDDSGQVVASGHMQAADGSFDSHREDLVASIAAWASPIPPGIYQISVTGRSVAVDVGEPSSTYVAVYDPTAGFVTGGGWINSPEEALTLDPTMKGRASFAFVSKYKRGATRPDGKTEFHFTAGDVHFSSDTYDWLVINQNGRNAQIRGSGTLNGISGFGFMMWAVDGQANGSPDTFRISIWDMADDDAVIYDNKTSTELGGGSIVIHIGK